MCNQYELLLCLPDMNECTESGMCPNGRCENMDGAYKCICDEGYRQSPNQQICYGMLHCSPYRKKILLEFKLCNFALSELAPELRLTLSDRSPRFWISVLLMFIHYYDVQ